MSGEAGPGTPLDTFLEYVRVEKKLFWPSIERNLRKDPSLFRELGEPMARWAECYLGPGFERVLADGYQAFVLDVNRSQAEYEGRGRYRHSSYQQVRAEVYDNPDYMERYHWGVYVTTFAWEHHLRLYRFFRDYFLETLAPEGEMLELGAGSGIWAMLALLKRPGWRVRGLDISATSVSHANGFVHANGMAERIRCERADAVSHRGPKPADAVMSCFLLEHLERPEELIDSLSHNLKAGGRAFVTAALTAAERDHIYEMRRESEVVLLAEERGLRLVSLYSASPAEHPKTSVFLPRSAGLVLQKRRNDVW